MIVRLAVKDLVSTNKAMRLSAVAYFQGDQFEQDCLEAGYPYAKLGKAVAETIELPAVQQERAVKEILETLKK